MDFITHNIDSGTQPEVIRMTTKTTVELWPYLGLRSLRVRKFILGFLCTSLTLWGLYKFTRKPECSSSNVMTAETAELIFVGGHESSGKQSAV
ncbi:hypothetical protein PHET_10481 [Paragonimus heterotremus]|uniref:Uncharacterized protein n=1 Tax=Paragonimus heterotremus TaxID=100268 RepID=A0A8J4SG79_9TREM|nr:hypothetical protein PHET_10481 [Paragonimus heterotremus]